MMMSHKQKAFEQREGEPDFWYGRFIKFCLYGPSRSLMRCYQDVLGERDLLFELQAPKPMEAEEGQETSIERARPARKRLPKVWREKAKRFDWWERAAAWDMEQRRIAMELVEAAKNLCKAAAEEAVQFQWAMMRGYVINPDGEKVAVNEMQQRRLASNSILNRAGVVHDGLLADEDDGEPPVVGIVIHDLTSD